MNNASKEFIRRIEQKLGLLYVEKQPETNTCFANDNAALRDDFKQIFTHQDVQYYLNAIQSQGDDSFPVPENENVFWNLVRKGMQNKSE